MCSVQYLPSTGFYLTQHFLECMGLRSGDWLGHSRTLMCFFLSHSFVALAMCFRSLSCWNTHPWPIFNALALTVHGPGHRPFDAVQLSCPLSRKTPPKHNVSTSMFDGGDGVLGVISRIRTVWMSVLFSHHPRKNPWPNYLMFFE